MFYVVFTPCGRKSVVKQPNLQDLYEIGCDRMWWHLNTFSDVVVPNARMHVYIIQYRTMLMYSFNHSYYFPLLPDHIINSLPANSCKKNIQTWHGIWCDPTQSRCFSMSVTVAARFQTAILFFCIADLANIVSWLKNFRFMIGNWSCLFVAMETWPTTKAPRKIHKKREMDMETVGELVGEICRHDLGSKSFDKIKKKWWLTICAEFVALVNVKTDLSKNKYRLVSSSIYNANLFENMNLPVLPACYFGIQYNKVSKLLPKNPFPNFTYKKFVQNKDPDPNAAKPAKPGRIRCINIPCHFSSISSKLLFPSHKSLMTLPLGFHKCRFFWIPGGCFGGVVPNEIWGEGVVLKVLIWGGGGVNMSWDKQTRIACVLVVMFVRIIVLYLSLRFSVSWYH